MRFFVFVVLFPVILTLSSGCKSAGDTVDETPVDELPVLRPDPAVKKPDLDVVDVSGTSQWAVSLYSKYTPEKFRSFPPANQRIDFSKIDYPLLNAAVFYETNRRRREMELPDFQFSLALEKAAMDHSKDMVKLDFYSHTSPVAGRENPKVRLNQVGINNAFTAENINIGFGIAYEGGRPVYTPDQNQGKYFSYDLNGVPLPPQTYNSLARSVVDSWMNSPGHRRNILSPDLKFMGIGSAHYRDAKFFQMDKFKVTQNFASEPGKLP